MLSNVVLVVVKTARYVIAHFNALKVFKDLKAEGQITLRLLVDTTHDPYSQGGNQGIAPSGDV